MVPQTLWGGAGGGQGGRPQTPAPGVGRGEGLNHRSFPATEGEVEEERGGAVPQRGKIETEYLRADRPPISIVF